MAGWVAIVIVISDFTPAGFIGFFGALVWVLIVSIALYMRQPEAGAPTPSTADAG